MFTANKDRVIQLWEPLPRLPGCLIERVQDGNFDRSFIFNSHPGILHRIIGCVAYDFARFSDGGPLLRPDLLAELCFALHQSPSRLGHFFEVDAGEMPVLNPGQQEHVHNMLTQILASPCLFIAGEVRTPWDDADLRLFASRLLGALDDPMIQVPRARLY